MKMKRGRKRVLYRAERVRLIYDTVFGELQLYFMGGGRVEQEGNDIRGAAYRVIKLAWNYQTQFCYSK